MKFRCPDDDKKWCTYDTTTQSYAVNPEGNSDFYGAASNNQFGLEENYDSFSSTTHKSRRTSHATKHSRRPSNNHGDSYGYSENYRPSGALTGSPEHSDRGSSNLKPVPNYPQIGSLLPEIINNANVNRERAPIPSGKNQSLTTLVINEGDPIVEIEDQFCKDNPDIVTLTVTAPGVFRQFVHENLLKRCKKLENLTIANAGIIHLPSIFLPDRSKLKYLSLSNNRISGISSTTIGNHPNLEVFNFERNAMFSIPEGMFDDMGKLKVLKMNQNELRQLEKPFFLNQGKLESLELQNNYIRGIVDGGFRGLRSLRILNLADNKLRVLRPATFEDLNKLEKLDVSRNEISELEGTTFRALRKLKELNLSNNRLKNIKAEILGTNNAIEEIDLSENKILSVEEGFMAKLQEANIRMVKNPCYKRELENAPDIRTKLEKCISNAYDGENFFILKYSKRTSLL